MKLKPLQLAILQALAKLPPDTELLTYEIGHALPTDVLPKYASGHYKRLSTLVANTLGPNLGALQKAGLVIGRKNPAASKGHGNSSYWKLGPKSDELKEQGIL